MGVRRYRDETWLLFKKDVNPTDAASVMTRPCALGYSAKMNRSLDPSASIPLQGPIPQGDGATFQLSKLRLRHRQAPALRADAFKAAVKAAWESAVARYESTRIPAFPAVNPIRGDLQSVIGKTVVLGPLSATDWLKEASHPFLVAGNAAQGFYFLDGWSPAANAMSAALERFRRRVWPGLPEQYSLIARITGGPDLRVVGLKAQFGLRIELLAACIGDCLFVELDEQTHETAPFLGEPELGDELPVVPSTDASPIEVARCAVNALVAGNADAFRKLFTEKMVEFYPNGLPGYRAYRPRDFPSADSEWTQLRSLLENDVYDIFISGSGEVRQVMTGKELGEFPSGFTLPAVYQVAVSVTYIGKFGEEYRAMTRPDLRTQWMLQREDSGPWLLVPPNPPPTPQKTEMQSLLDGLTDT